MGSYKILAGITLRSQCFLSHKTYQIVFSVMCFPLQKCSRFRAKFSASVEKRTRMILSKRTTWSNCGQILFNFVFFSDKLSHYKTYDFRKFLIPDAFKHVWLQNAFNKCKFHQILPLMVDYACFFLLFGEMYKLSERNVYIKNLFLARSSKILVIEHSFLQKSCKNAIASKNLARMPLHPRILQKLNFFARILQDLARNKFSVN